MVADDADDALLTPPLITYPISTHWMNSGYRQLTREVFIAVADFTVPKSGDLHSAGMPAVTLRAERRVAKFRVLLKDKPSPVNAFTFETTAHTVQALFTSQTKPFAEGIDALGNMYYGASGIYELPWCMSTMGDFHTSGAGRYQMCQTNSTVFSPFLFAGPEAGEIPVKITDIRISGKSGGFSYKTDEVYTRSLACSTIAGIVFEATDIYDDSSSQLLIDVVEAADDAGHPRKRGNALRFVLRVERHVLLKTRSHEKFILHTVRIFVPAAVGIVHRGEARRLPAPRRKRCGDTPVERFQTRPPYRPSDLEPEFAERIHSLDYLLYAEGRLIGQGRADDIRAADGNSYLFRLDTLPFGNYRLAFAANAAPRMMTGTTDAPELRYIVYQGEKGADDHFRADLPFEVTCPCRNEFEAVLRRVYGVTRFRFENLPAEIASVEVSLDNVGERMPLCGDPDRPCEVARRIPVTDMAARADGTYTLGTFCTLPGMKTAWRLKLYNDDGPSPFTTGW